MKKELVLEIIQERWSPYSFSSNPVEEYKLKAMLEAAGYAPSCFNEQPWMFVYTTRQNKKVFDDYLGFMVESNRVWAENSYAIIISMARMTFSYNGSPNRYAFHDTGMAVSNLLLQAYSMDVYVHQMAGFHVDKVKEYFKLGNDIEPVAMMAVGYLGDGLSLSPELLAKDETRRPKKHVNEFAFKESFENLAFEK
ncbi:MAG TPA: nitroreductase family protein [Bacteroidales bacterium]|nr:nitroreductase family protein [Bacteroidales bacterium]